MPRYYRIKNWAEFQHYKERTPPWIKLHRSLLDDYEFCALPDTAKGHLMLLWLFASQNEGRIPADARFLEQKVSANTKIDLPLLEKAGFLVPEHDASTSASTSASSTLADCAQHASPRALAREEERREEKRREEQNSRFDRFWAAYPKKRNRGDAERAWAKLRPDDGLTDRIVQAVEVAKTRDDWRKDGGQFIPYPASWLNAKGWLDGDASAVSDGLPWWVRAGHGTRESALAAGLQEQAA